MSEEWNDDAEAKFKLMQEFDERVNDDAQPSREDVFKGKVNSPSALEGGGFRFGWFELVGHGQRTNNLCGAFHHINACSRVELHDKTVFDVKSGRLINFKGLADVRAVFHSCDKPSCPICYERGWAVRGADNINFRLLESAKRLDHVAFGDPEHVIVSVDPVDYGLSEARLRRKIDRGLKDRGVVGGCVISHYARFDGELRKWYLGIHFHILGFIQGTMRRCRGCSHVDDKGSRFFCGGCDGFYGRSKACYPRDRLIVEVKDERKSIFGTAWYQLHHATLRHGAKRDGVVRWFGVCSYRRMKIPKSARKVYDDKKRAKCRICGGELTRHEYRGLNPLVLGWLKKRRGAREKVEPIFDCASDYVESPKGRCWGDG